MLSELLVVGVTLFATSHRKGLEGALGCGKISLSEVLFRDGASFSLRSHSVDTGVYSLV